MVYNVSEEIGKTFRNEGLGLGFFEGLGVRWNESIIHLSNNNKYHRFNGNVHRQKESDKW